MDESRLAALEAQIAKLSALVASLIDKIGDTVVTGVVQAAALVVPEGMVAIYPTGSRAATKARIWPAPLDGENAFGYGIRVRSILDKDGHPYIPAGSVARVMLGTPAGAAANATPPEIWDRLLYPTDWWNESDWSMDAALQARDAAEGAAWLSRTNAPVRARTGSATDETVVPVEQG